MDNVTKVSIKQEVIRDADLRNAVDKKKILNVLNQGEEKRTKKILYSILEFS
jgi:hypothetical protein